MGLTISKMMKKSPENYPLVNEMHTNNSGRRLSTTSTLSASNQQGITISSGVFLQDLLNVVRKKYTHVKYLFRHTKSGLLLIGAPVNTSALNLILGHYYNANFAVRLNGTPWPAAAAASGLAVAAELTLKLVIMGILNLSCMKQVGNFFKPENVPRPVFNAVDVRLAQGIVEDVSTLKDIILFESLDLFCAFLVHMFNNVFFYSQAIKTGAANWEDALGAAATTALLMLGVYAFIDIAYRSQIVIFQRKYNNITKSDAIRIFISRSASKYFATPMDVVSWFMVAAITWLEGFVLQLPKVLATVSTSPLWQTGISPTINRDSFYLGAASLGFGTINYFLQKLLFAVADTVRHREPNQAKAVNTWSKAFAKQVFPFGEN